jgi:hypothetical protein
MRVQQSHEGDGDGGMVLFRSAKVSGIAANRGASAHDSLVERMLCEVVACQPQMAGVIKMLRRERAGFEAAYEFDVVHGISLKLSTMDG